MQATLHANLKSCLGMRSMALQDFTVFLLNLTYCKTYEISTFNSAGNINQTLEAIAPISVIH